MERELVLIYVAGKVPQKCGLLIETTPSIMYILFIITLYMTRSAKRGPFQISKFDYS